ncbi:MAG: WD40 repeat domain-containing protein [Candidatus Micrarchaeota archaeon]
MRKIFAFLFFAVFIFGLVSAEDKYGVDVPKLTEAEMVDAPEITAYGVYPPMGSLCTEYTYFVRYKDGEGREPSYVRIWMNGELHDMNKQSGDAETGALYTFTLVPTSGKQLFYYFEASNGAGKVRAAMIDSPDQGPVLYSEKFDNNEIVLLDENGKELWTFSTGTEIVYHVALTDDGGYLAAATDRHIYLFSKDSNDPLWSFCKDCDPISLSFGVNTAVGISGDGEFVAAAVENQLYYFARNSNTPLWKKDISCNGIGLELTETGDFIAVSVSNCGENGNTIYYFDGEGNEVWHYQTSTPGYENSGEFYAPAMTPGGECVAVSSGCPDRRAYLFSKDGTLLFRSEPLQRDAPVHSSAISDDCSLIAFGSDGESGKPNKFLFAKDGSLEWSHTGSQETDARAASISADGDYAAFGTSNGRVYLFDTSSGTLLWMFQEQGTFAKVGDVKLNSDGSKLVAGSTGRKVYLFSRASSTPVWSYTSLTWVNAVDFKNGVIAAGTGFKEYQFEGNSVSLTEVACSSVEKPEGFETFVGMSGLIDIAINTGNEVCGNSMCEPSGGENFETCPQDCMACDDEVEDCSKINDNPNVSDEPAFCGDSDCELGNGESVEACPQDCGGVIATEPPEPSLFAGEVESKAGVDYSLAAIGAVVVLALGGLYWFTKKK